MKQNHVTRAFTILCLLVLPVLLTGGIMWGMTTINHNFNSNDEGKEGNNIQTMAVKTDGLRFSAAVFSLAPDPVSGIIFTYRVGMSILAGFGASVVHFTTSKTTSMQLEFPGSAIVLPRGLEPLASKTSYLFGNDPSKWFIDQTDFGGVLYEGLYPGIDLQYTTKDGSLKYEFIVHAGANPANIMMQYSNAEAVWVHPGEVQVVAGGESMLDTGLFVYQQDGISKKMVECEFTRAGDRVVMFSTGPYDITSDLIIDPVNILSYGTYLGGNSSDVGYAIAVENGAVYVAGITESVLFPTTAGAHDTNSGGGKDVFIAKLSVDGKTLLYSTFLGGNVDDRVNDIAVENGFVYITGYTDSDPFPTTAGAYDQIFNGNTDAFIVKLSVDGGTLLYSTYLGGAGPEFGEGIDVENGFVYVTGESASNPFPTTASAYDVTHNGGFYDVFITKLSVNGSALVYSTYVGGESSDFAYAIDVENAEVYITGYTQSNSFPTTAGAYDVTFNGNSDVFVAKLSRDGSMLLYSTYLGGSSSEFGYGIAVENGVAHVTGYATSNPFPTTPGAYDVSFNGGLEAFVSKLAVDGSTLLYSTYLGGSDIDNGRAITVENGIAYVTGETQSNPFPTTGGAYDATFNGVSDAFIAKVSGDGSMLFYSTYIGGAGTDGGYDIDVENGAAYITGFSDSDPFPTTTEAYDVTYNGGSSDAILVKLTQDLDEDGMHDDWEITHGLNSQGNDAGGDLDADGLVNFDEFQSRTRPDKVDTDDDGMLDGWEVQQQLDPLINDFAPDVDGDGLSNGMEHLHRTNATRSDTDNDGFSDGVEVARGTNPLDPADYPENYMEWFLIGIGAVAIVSFIATIALHRQDKQQISKLTRDIERLRKIPEAKMGTLDDTTHPGTKEGLPLKRGSNQSGKKSHGSGNK